MKYCRNCGKQLFDEAVICPGCGCKVGDAEDTINGGLVALSVFLPLFGIIYWPINAEKKPKTAKACGIAAIISWVCGMVISLISYAIMINI